MKLVCFNCYYMKLCIFCHWDCYVCLTLMSVMESKDYATYALTYSVLIVSEDTLNHLYCTKIDSNVFTYCLTLSKSLSSLYKCRAAIPSATFLANCQQNSLLFSHENTMMKYNAFPNSLFLGLYFRPPTLLTVFGKHSLDYYPKSHYYMTPVIFKNG